MGHDVFISYSSKDKKVADAACALIERRGHRCWIAPRDILPGVEWGEAIIDGIREARVFVLIFSANANFSQQVRREVERAAGHGLPIIPFRIEDVAPAKSLEFFIMNQHWLDALTPPMEAHLDRLAGAIDRLLDVPRQPPPSAMQTHQRRGAHWAASAAALALFLAVAAAIAYAVLPYRDAPAPANDLAEANEMTIPIVNSIAEAESEPEPPPRPEPAVPLLDFASIPVSPEPGSITPAEPHLRRGAVPASVSEISPAGAQLLFVHRRSLNEGRALNSPGSTLLVLETPGRSSASFTLRFATPVAEFRTVRPSFDFYFCLAALTCAATADHLTFPAFTVTALNDRGQPVARARREIVRDDYAVRDTPGDTIALVAEEGIREVRFQSEDGIVYEPAMGREQPSFRAFIFESMTIRRMPAR